MTPEEKAKELIDKYFYLFSVELENTIDNYEAKQCALIAVDEIINLKLLWFQKDSKDLQYWNEVEQEIEKL